MHSYELTVASTDQPYCIKLVCLNTVSDLSMPIYCLAVFVRPGYFTSKFLLLIITFYHFIMMPKHKFNRNRKTK